MKMRYIKVTCLAAAVVASSFLTGCTAVRYSGSTDSVTSAPGSADVLRRYGASVRADQLVVMGGKTAPVTMAPAADAQTANAIQGWFSPTAPKGLQVSLTGQGGEQKTPLFGLQFFTVLGTMSLIPMFAHVDGSTTMTVSVGNTPVFSNTENFRIGITDGFYFPTPMLFGSTNLQKPMGKAYEDQLALHREALAKALTAEDSAYTAVGQVATVPAYRDYLMKNQESLPRILRVLRQ